MATTAGDVYGGYQWFQQEIYAAIQAALLELQQAQQSGWITAGGSEAVKRATKKEALLAIWKNRPDIKEFYDKAWGASAEDSAANAIWGYRPDLKTYYDQMWGAGQYKVADAIDNWLSMTTEDLPSEDLVELAKAWGLTVSEGYDPEDAVLDWIGMTNEELSSDDPIELAEGWGYVPKESAGSAGSTSPTLEREQYQTNAALQYLNLLASKSGPQDWLTYWNIQRSAQQTQVPSWASTLAQGLGFAPYQGTQYVPAAGTGTPAGISAEDVPVNAGANTSQAAGATSAGGSQVPTWAQQFTQNQQVQLPWIQPQQVKPTQWNNMMPSEQAGLQGLVQQYGGYFPDWLQQMQNAWPTGQATPITQFAGW